MRKWAIGVLAALLLFVSSALALADSEGTIVQSSCSVVPSGDYYLVYCYAQVHNNTNAIIGLEEGYFDLYSGEEIIATQDVAQIWPGMIGPGEDGYIFDVVAFEPDENGQPVVPQVTNIDFSIRYMMTDVEFASVPMAASAEIQKDQYGGLTVETTVTNGSDVTAYNPTITFGLYTDGGAMVYADGMNLRNVGVPAGGSMILRFPVDDEIAEQWNSYGANITQVQVNASFRDGTD